MQHIKELLKFYKEIGADYVEMDSSLLNRTDSWTLPRQLDRTAPKSAQKVRSDESIDFKQQNREKKDSLDTIKIDIFKCNACPLHRTKTNYVPGEGSDRPDLMFIGEGPGETEDRLGRPFVGDAGNLLDKIIEKMGYRRSNVYIANIVKCRPPGNRTPGKSEAAACIPYLKRQIKLLSPKVIICLGKTATNYLLDEEYAITRVRGKRFSYGNIPVIPTFHPSYILHQRSKEATSKAKWSVWEDVQKALALLKM